MRQLTFELTQRKISFKFLRSLQVQELMPEAESLGTRLLFIIVLLVLQVMGIESCYKWGEIYHGCKKQLFLSENVSVVIVLVAYVSS